MGNCHAYFWAISCFLCTANAHTVHRHNINMITQNVRLVLVCSDQTGCVTASCAFLSLCVRVLCLRSEQRDKRDSHMCAGLTCAARLSFHLISANSCSHAWPTHYCIFIDCVRVCVCFRSVGRTCTKVTPQYIDAKIVSIYFRTHVTRWIAREKSYK